MIGPDDEVATGRSDNLEALDSILALADLSTGGIQDQPKFPAAPSSGGMDFVL